MFAGIVEETGSFLGFENETVTFAANTALVETAIGASINVNGCCLTVIEKSDDRWKAQVVAETLSRTTLGSLKAGEKVNLERAARFSDRINGHVVQGHVDAVAEVLVAAPQLRIQIPESLLKYVVEKGSIAIDGVSLTIVNVFSDGIDVALIPHTLEITNLGNKQPGDKVNIEVDVMAKYAERILTYANAFYKNSPGIDPDTQV